MTILLTALLWVLISIPVAIAVGTVISFGQSGRPRFQSGGPSNAAPHHFDKE